MVTIEQRIATMLAEAEQVPAEVRAALAAAGFKPELDAGNLWFFDSARFRLVFGEDGSDLPMSLGEPVTVCVKTDSEDFGVEFATLAEALRSLA